MDTGWRRAGVRGARDNLPAHRGTGRTLVLAGRTCAVGVRLPTDVRKAYLNLIEPWWKVLRSLALGKGRRFESVASRSRRPWEPRDESYWNAHCHLFSRTGAEGGGTGPGEHPASLPSRASGDLADAPLRQPRRMEKSCAPRRTGCPWLMAGWSSAAADLVRDQCPSGPPDGIGRPRPGGKVELDACTIC